jgi:hypothetical protein
MKYAAEMRLVAMIYIPSFIKFGLRHSEVDKGDTQTHTDRKEIAYAKFRKVG